MWLQVKPASFECIFGQRIALAVQLFDSKMQESGAPVGGQVARPHQLRYAHGAAETTTWRARRSKPEPHLVLDADSALVQGLHHRGIESLKVGPDKDATPAPMFVLESILGAALLRVAPGVDASDFPQLAYQSILFVNFKADLLMEVYNALQVEIDEYFKNAEQKSPCQTYFVHQWIDLTMAGSDFFDKLPEGLQQRLTLTADENTWKQVFDMDPSHAGDPPDPPQGPFADDAARAAAQAEYEASLEFEEYNRLKARVRTFSLDKTMLIESLFDAQHGLAICRHVEKMLAGFSLSSFVQTSQMVRAYLLLQLGPRGGMDARSLEAGMRFYEKLLKHGVVEAHDKVRECWNTIDWMSIFQVGSFVPDEIPEHLRATGNPRVAVSPIAQGFQNAEATHVKRTWAQHWGPTFQRNLTIPTWAYVNRTWHVTQDGAQARLKQLDCDLALTGVSKDKEAVSEVLMDRFLNIEHAHKGINLLLSRDGNSDPYLSSKNKLDVCQRVLEELGGVKTSILSLAGITACDSTLADHYKLLQESLHLEGPDARLTFMVQRCKTERDEAKEARRDGQSTNTAKILEYIRKEGSPFITVKAGLRSIMDSPGTASASKVYDCIMQPKEPWGSSKRCWLLVRYMTDVSLKVSALCDEIFRDLEVYREVTYYGQYMMLLLGRDGVLGRRADASFEQTPPLAAQHLPEAFRTCQWGTHMVDVRNDGYIPVAAAIEDKSLATFLAESKELPPMGAHARQYAKRHEWFTESLPQAKLVIANYSALLQGLCFDLSLGEDRNLAEPPSSDIMDVNHPDGNILRSMSLVKALTIIVTVYHEGLTHQERQYYKGAFDAMVAQAMKDASTTAAHMTRSTDAWQRRQSKLIHRESLVAVQFAELLTMVRHRRTSAARDKQLLNFFYGVNAKAPDLADLKLTVQSCEFENLLGSVQKASFWSRVDNKQLFQFEWLKNSSSSDKPKDASNAKAQKVNCNVCGKSFQASSLQEGACRTCRIVRDKVFGEAVCVTCNKTFVKRDASQKKCSPQCKKKPLSGATQPPAKRAAPTPSPFAALGSSAAAGDGQPAAKQDIGLVYKHPTFQVWSKDPGFGWNVDDMTTEMRKLPAPSNGNTFSMYCPICVVLRELQVPKFWTHCPIAEHQSKKGGGVMGHFPSDIDAQKSKELFSKMRKPQAQLV